jgi:hypothetical protein
MEDPGDWRITLGQITKLLIIRVGMDGSDSCLCQWQALVLAVLNLQNLLPELYLIP